MDKITNRELREHVVIGVEFFRPVEGHTLWLFGSYAAAFVKFGRDTLGLSLYQLQHANITKGSPLITNKCVVRRLDVYRLKNKKPRE